MFFKEGGLLMKQSWDEYVEGRLAIGGCGLTLLIIGIVIAVIIIAINNFINDFSIGKLLFFIFIVVSIIGVIINTIIEARNNKK